MKKWTVIVSVSMAIATTGVLRPAAQTQSTAENCVSYNPSTLKLTNEVDGSWLISRDDGARFMPLDTKQDADVMMAVFKAHESLCYVGRGNKRANRMDFVHTYWK